MKNLFICLLLLIVVASAGVMSRNDAYQKITDTLLSGDLDGRSILAMNRLVPGGDMVADVHGQTFRAPSTSFFFLVDDHFTANWDHPCRYVFVDINSGDMTVYPADAPVRQWQAMDTLFTSDKSDGLVRANTYSIPVAMPKQMLENGKKIRLNNTVGENYAILLSGGYNPSNNHGRYYGDIKWQVRALKERYGYTNDHIYIAMSDGTDPGLDQHIATGYINSDPDVDQDGEQEVHYQATMNDGYSPGFNSLINDIKVVTTSEDNLHVFITDHGGGSGTSSYINLWNMETMSYQTFKSLLDTVPHAYMSACNEVCESGGLILAYDGAENVALATACTAYQSSYARAGHLYDYNEFTFWWTGAVYGTTAPPENIDCSAADTDQDDSIDMLEAFTWAQLHDAQPEQPQWYENPAGFGSNLTLGGLEEYTGVNITRIEASKEKADRITVEWAASDTSTLAGFNIYRAIPGNPNRFEKLNSRPIVGNSPFHYDDLAVVKGQKYTYKLETVETTGFKSFAGPVWGMAGNGLPTNFALNVYPNPAHGAVKLDYSIASTAGNTNTRLAVIDLSGRTVKVLVDAPVAPGAYAMQWDGTDSVGRAVSPGVYICTMNAGGQHLTKRIVFAH
jgi:hypothetical protein